MKNNFDQITEQHLAFIHRLTLEMAQTSDDQQLLRFILEKLMQRTAAEVGAFVYYDSAGKTFEPRIVRCSSSREKESPAFSQTVFNTVKEKREALLSFDTSSDEELAGTRSVMINKINAILAFPLMVNRELYGVMYFDSRESRQSFNEETRQLLSFFAPIASITLEQALSRVQADHENRLLKSQLEPVQPLPRMIGKSSEIQKLYSIVKKVAANDISVLITGENGTGKDLVARAIHDLSERKEKPFIAQFVGNIPSTILDSELFGYKRGAFTGANADKPGLFEAVDGGTVFLDEISELSMDLQTKLLRVLQNKEIKRLGENIVRTVDVRILAASNRDIKKMVREGNFREDLYYRLNVITIEVPALRERRDDIPVLAEHFLKQNGHQKMTLTRKAISKLVSYNWPGNVRQLENIIKRAAIMAEGDRIDEEHILFDEDENAFSGTMEEFKNRLIAQRIKQFNGNKTLAAKSLDMSLRAIQLKAKELDL